MKRALSLLLFSSIASARSGGIDDAQDACMTQADRGQSLRDEGKLIEAREQLLSCARDPCASVISKQCATWLQGVDAQMPTVAFRAKGADGRDVAAVRVLVDGKPLVTTLDGHPIPVNPGVHVLVYQHDGDPDMQETVVIRAGEKNRPIDIELAGPAKVEPPPPPPAADTQRRPFRFPVGAGIALGLGAAGFVTMAGLVGVASDDASRLRRTCAPVCPPSDVDGARAKITGANVALAIGVTALGVAALWLIFANYIHSQSGSSAPRKAVMDPVLHF